MGVVDFRLSAGGGALPLEVACSSKESLGVRAAEGEGLAVASLEGKGVRTKNCAGLSRGLYTTPTSSELRLSTELMGALQSIDGYLLFYIP